MSTSLVLRGSRALRADDAARRWLDFVRNIPRLSDDEATALAERFRAGDALAGEQLVAAHLYVVVQVAARLRVRRDAAFDLIQEGNAGLLDALHRYEPARGVPFSVYSRYWARARMLAYVSSHARLVSAGRPTRRRMSALIREVERREAAGLPTDDASLARALDLDEAQIDDIRQAARYGEAAFDAPGPTGLTLADRLADPGSDPEAALASHELSSRVADAVVSFADTLRPRDQILFFERIASDEPTSLADLGRRFGVSRERARQIEARILPRFRAHLEEAGLAALAS